MNSAKGQEQVKIAAHGNDLGKGLLEDEFLSVDNLIPLQREAADRCRRQTLGEIEELAREKRWKDIISIFYPVEEKLPELAGQNQDIRIREKIAFALGQLNRFDEAIRELNECILREPDNFYHHNSMAYTAYDSLYAAKNRELFLSGKARSERIKLAHEHFKCAQAIRPQGITNYYREGMLFIKMENKSEKAIPLFQKAVCNWDKLTENEKQARHQERKNFIKSLYQHSSALLARGRAKASLAELKRCLAEDDQSNYVSLVFKYFALGKVNYQLNRFGEARDALLFAMQCKADNSIDYVYELLARTYLALGNADRAREIINKVPQKNRRPYYRWTEADILCSLGDFEGAKKSLIRCQERDSRSRHKALIRLARIEYLLQNFEKAKDYAEQADAFFSGKWGNRLDDGLFWQAISAFRLGDLATARKLADELQDHHPGYEKLDQLMAKLSGKL